MSILIGYLLSELLESIADDGPDNETESGPSPPEHVGDPPRYNPSQSVKDISAPGMDTGVPMPPFSMHVGTPQLPLWMGSEGADIIEDTYGYGKLVGNGGNDHLLGLSGDDDLHGGTGDDTLEGGADNDWMFGDVGNDTIIGGAGNDLLDGGKDADFLIGGSGDDQYVVDDPRDQVFDEVGDQGGHDKVFTTWTSYDLRAWNKGFGIEDLQYSGLGNFTGYGNERDNVITGAYGNDTLYGLGGNDTLIGGDGRDVLEGGLGNDTYVVDKYDMVVEEPGYFNDTGFVGGGIDTVVTDRVSYQLPDHVENLTFSRSGPSIGYGNAANNVIIGSGGRVIFDGKGGNDTLIGDEHNDTLRGGADNDMLDGGVGADWLQGGQGDDTYRISGSPTADTVVELAGEGTDTVEWTPFTLLRVGSNPSAPLYTLRDNVENLTILGTRNGNGTGNALDNVMVGNEAANTLRGLAGNDTLDGGIGADRLEGGQGDDTYRISGSPTADTVVELAGEGTDTVEWTPFTLLRVGPNPSAPLYTLGDNVENLAILGTRNGNGTGNALDNVMVGNEAANTLIGLGGNDTLEGGLGADTYAFADNWGHDTVTDFAGGADRIDMREVTGLWSVSQLAKENTAEGALLTFAGNTILLRGVDAAALTSADFLFARAPVGETFDGTALWGGAIRGSAGIDTVSFAGAQHAIYVDLLRDGGYAEGLGPAQSAGVSSIENVTGSATMLNYLHGNEADNVLIGGDHFDWLVGRGGDNVLDGRGSINFADYYETDAPVSIDLTTGKATHSTGVDTLINIQQFRGTNASDEFRGDGQDNYFLGMNGDDRVFGGGGNDTLDGSGNDDTLDGGEGDDVLIGASGDDTLTGGAGADRFVYGDSLPSRDRILDFAAAQGDRIDFSGLPAIASFADLTITANPDGHALVAYGDNTILLVGVTPDQVNAGWFVY